ncbi:hypothetical protein [Wigglesworthia glossinidia]|uniref:hypothetical protein n=1 Tax=Wigglesworthia glossinidia TaxID=51229 RepID=UPI0002E96CF5|nr:hypothetical protein [Wigglesworthia glossinidia]
MLYNRHILHFFLILSVLFSGCSIFHKEIEIHKNFKDTQKNLNNLAQLPYYHIYGSFFLILKKIH